MYTRREDIQRNIEELAAFSSVRGCGCTRMSYTKEFKQAGNYLKEEMKKAGLTVREDPAGTVIGRLEGKDPSRKLPILMTGSHFDTVKTGGRFDGAAGVIAALEAARCFQREALVPDYPIEFVAMPEEEGGRFGGGLFASRAMIGALSEDELQVRMCFEAYHSDRWTTQFD